MVNYTLISDYDNMTLTQFLAYPNTGFEYFYVVLILGIVFIMSSLIYYREVNSVGSAQANYLSSLAVTCFSGIVIGVFASILTLISLEGMILLFILLIIPIAIWWFGTK